MEATNATALDFKDFRQAGGELDKASPFFAQLYDDICERVQPGLVTVPAGSVLTDLSLFDYLRANEKELLLYRWTQTARIVGLHFPKTVTRYSVATFERNKLANIQPMPTLKGQAVAWWISHNLSPIKKLQERGWL